MVKEKKIFKVLQPFKESYQKGYLAFLVGAGASWDEPACRPLASEISSAVGSVLWSISTIAKDKWKSKTIQQYTRALRFETLMQILAETTGSLSFLNALKGGKPNLLHKLFADALLKKCPLLTTNFDELIERAMPNDKNIEIEVSI